MMTNELYTQAANGSEQALWTLCKNYEPLFKSEARLYQYKMADAYDVADFVSIGYITVWDIIRKGNFDPEQSAFGAYLKQAIQWRFRKEFRNFSMKNMVCIGVDEDFYGTTTRAYVIHESVDRERELTKARQQRWYERKIAEIDAERARQGLPKVYRKKYATEEERAAHDAQVRANARAAQKRYQMEHKEEIRAKKAAYYQKNKRRYRLNSAIRDAKSAIVKWTERGNEARAQQARERLARYEEELAQIKAAS